MLPEEMRNIKSDFLMLQLSLRKDLAVFFFAGLWQFLDLVCGFWFLLRAHPRTVISGNTGLSF